MLISGFLNNIDVKILVGTLCSEEQPKPTLRNRKYFFTSNKEAAMRVQLQTSKVQRSKRNRQASQVSSGMAHRTKFEFGGPFEWLSLISFIPCKCLLYVQCQRRALVVVRKLLRDRVTVRKKDSPPNSNVDLCASPLCNGYGFTTCLYLEKRF